MESIGEVNGLRKVYSIMSSVPIAAMADDCNQKSAGSSLPAKAAVQQPPVDQLLFAVRSSAFSWFFSKTAKRCRYCSEMTAISYNEWPARNALIRLLCTS